MKELTSVQIKSVQKINEEYNVVDFKIKTTENFLEFLNSFYELYNDMQSFEYEEPKIPEATEEYIARLMQSIEMFD